MYIDKYKIVDYPGLKPRVVVIGGGTGLSILLRGLKNYTGNITAIVTVADDGGNSGKLREDLGILPPGDIRACLLALANTEPSLGKLFNYRFKEGKLEGQNVGNLLIAAMNDIYGSFEEAIREMSNVLAVTGKVLPMTLSDVKLFAELENGVIVKGESKIPKKVLEEKSPIKKIYTRPEVSYPLEEALDAIDCADLIVFGPGSLYTSVIPNLLVEGIVEKVYKSKAKKIYISNIMTQPGETDEYSLSDHILGIINHSRKDMLDYVIANIQPVDRGILKKYRKDGSELVEVKAEDLKFLKSLGIKFIGQDLAFINKGYIRHNSEVLSRVLISIAGATMGVKRRG